MPHGALPELQACYRETHIVSYVLGVLPPTLSPAYTAEVAAVREGFFQVDRQMQIAIDDRAEMG